MKKILLLSILPLMSLVLLFATAPAPALAQSTVGNGRSVEAGLNNIADAFPAGAKQGKSVSEIAKIVIEWALYVSAMIAVIFIIIGGFTYMTARGNDSQAKNGRTTLVNALIGLAIIVLSWVIVQIVYTFLVTGT